MSAVTLEAQVESVLVALVKVAAAELTKLFESRYRASAVDVGRGEDAKEKLNSQTPNVPNTGGKKPQRSVGVQVEEDICSPSDSELGSPLFISESDCLNECRGEKEEFSFLPDITNVEDNDDAETEKTLLKEKDVAEPTDMIEEITKESPDSDSGTEVVLQVSAVLRPVSSPCAETTPKPLVVQPDTNNTSSDNIKFVCPLILKSDSPTSKSELLEDSIHVEPQQSSEQETAYSPPSSDGAIAPAQVGIWERIYPTAESKNGLQMKLKLTSPDKKLMMPCAVQLVNLNTLSKLGFRKLNDDMKSDPAQNKPGFPLLKDLRLHHGIHTGHRLCCFTPCGQGIWRLQKVVAHSRDGYTCGLCGKTYKRRKILRRHERFHTGEKPYPCSNCSKTFALRKSLRRHLRFHTGEKPHSCTQCGKSFRLRENLKAHLRFHSGEKPFSCTTCGKMFRIFRNLEKHNLSKCGFFVPSFRTIAGV